MHRFPIALVVFVAAAFAGCQPPPQNDALKRELEDARNQLRQCNDDKQTLQSVIVRQQKQVDTLLDLGDKRLDKIFHVKSIELGQYTGGVNLSGTDDNHDAIKVYLRPLDQDGSVIKAAGAVKIQFFDLAIPKDNLVGEYNWSPDEIGKQWSNNFVTYFYSFVCPWKVPPTHPDITIRVEFTDYLTGQVLSAQKQVAVKLPPPGSRPAMMPIVPHPQQATQAASRPAPTKDQLRELFKPTPAKPAPDTSKPSPGPSTQPIPTPLTNPKPELKPQPAPQPKPKPKPDPVAKPAPVTTTATTAPVGRTLPDTMPTTTPAATTAPAQAISPPLCGSAIADLALRGQAQTTQPAKPAPAPAAKSPDISGPPTRPAGQ